MPQSCCCCLVAKLCLTLLWHRDGIPVELLKILKDDAVEVLHSICQQIWKTEQWPQDSKMSVFVLIPKKGNAKRCSNYCTIVLISHASHVMLQILKASLLSYINWELSDVQAGFRKGRGNRDQIANSHWIIEKAREFQKNIYFCFIDDAKAFDCGDYNKLWKILQEMGISDHPTCLLRNLYAGQEPTVRTGHGTTDWFQIGKGVHQSCILSPCLFNLCAEYIKWNVGLDDSKAEIKIAGRNSMIPSLHGKYIGKKWKLGQILLSWALKSLQAVTAAMRLKDACFLERKLQQT